MGLLEVPGFEWTVGSFSFWFFDRSGGLNHGLLGLLGLLNYWRKEKKKRGESRASGCFWVGGEPSLPPVFYVLQFPNRGARFAFFQLRTGLFLFLFRLFPLFGFVIFGI